MIKTASVRLHACGTLPACILMDGFHLHSFLFQRFKTKINQDQGQLQDQSIHVKIDGTLNVTFIVITICAGMLHYFACWLPRWSFGSWNWRGVLPCCSIPRRPLCLKIHCLPSARIMLLRVRILQA